MKLIDTVLAFFGFTATSSGIPNNSAIKSSFVPDKNTIDLKKPSIHIQTRLMQLTASVSVDLRTLSGSCSFMVAKGKDISTILNRPWTRSSSKPCTCCSPNWCILTVDFSKGFTNTCRKSHASTTTRTVINFTKYTPVTTPAPITEDPSKNFYETPEAVVSIEHIFLYYVLPASICVVLVSVVACLWLRIKKHRRTCSADLITTNTTGNEVLYADLELKGTNNFQRRCNEESPYAQIQVSQ
ncbi:uncharacterized protein LOC111354776 isoform X2 [Spodoptera litura]|uniref:Uncharacterized protein LOC111354776 isoform X2 n=1 Tax=Spodoptera litura TaxID=69820 RepID=A0A9J7EAL6_SPOLT|nr:uncharacterized protein LOC111354776 isoform X2 [Spodoptera litura]